MCIFAIVQSYRYFTIYKERENLQEIISLGFLLIAAWFTVSGDLGFVKELNGISIYLISDIISLLGVIGFVITYLTNLDYIYRIPSPVYHILGFDTTGVCFYNKKVKTRGFELKPLQEILLTGVLSAISSLFKDAFQENIFLEQLLSSKYTILLEFSKTDRFAFAIIAAKPTWYVMQSLKQLMKYLEATNKVNTFQLRPGLVDLHKAEDIISPLIEKAFPYLDLVE